MRISKRISDEPADEPVYLTKDGLDDLKRQLVRLKNALPARIAEAQRTAAFGDRSDNAEYKEAKGHLRSTQWRILSLEDQIRRAAIIAPGGNMPGAVDLGSTVVIEAGGKQKTFEILGPHETDPAHGRISYQSPLGASLMHRKKGDMVTIPTASGPKTYRIVEIR